MFNPSVTLLCLWLFIFFETRHQLPRVEQVLPFTTYYCFSMWRHPKPDRPLKFEGLLQVARVGIWEAGLAHWVTSVPPFTALDSSGPDVSRTNVIIMDIRNFFKKNCWPWVIRGEETEETDEDLIKKFRDEWEGSDLRWLHSVQKQLPL